MKHLRLFEDNKKQKYTNPKYKVGDYVHLDMEPDFSYDDCLGQILKIDKNGFLVEPSDDEDDKTHDYYLNTLNIYPYSIKILDGVFTEKEKLIDRYLTEDEITYFEYLLKNKNVKKFNI